MTDSPRALSEQALVELNTALETSPTPADFLVQASSIVARPENQLRLHVELGTPEELVAGQLREKGRDVANAHVIYEYIGAKDRANASDGRLWTYLAFVTHRTYMETRWPLDAATNWRGRVRDRWLLTNPTRGSLIRHGIARLWWIAELTYDPHCEHPLAARNGDPFAYTRAVLSNEDRVLGLFDREVSNLPAVVRAVLLHAESGPAAASDKHIRGVMKDLTLEYGFRDLAFMSDNQVEELVTTFGAARLSSV